MNNPIVLFDGVCNLCDATVRFIIDHDSKGHIKFVSMQSVLGRKYLDHAGYDPERMKSLVLFKGDKVFIESSAVLRIFRYLDGVYKLLMILLIIPPFIRNFVYRFIAKNRYQWFGKREECRLISADLKDRFLP